MKLQMTITIEDDGKVMMTSRGDNEYPMAQTIWKELVIDQKHHHEESKDGYQVFMKAPKEITIRLTR